MTSGQGELAQAVIDFATGQVAPTYLTQDGAVNWLPAAAYDPLLGVSLATAVKDVPQAGSLRYDSQAGGLRYSPAPDLPIAAAIAPNLPDFVLADAAVTGGPATGEPLRAVVQIANSGAAWPGSAEQPLEIVAAWDGAPGIGAPAGQITLTSLGAAPFVTVTLDLTPPPAGLDAPTSCTWPSTPACPSRRRTPPTTAARSQPAACPRPCACGRRSQPGSAAGLPGLGGGGRSPGGRLSRLSGGGRRDIAADRQQLRAGLC